MKIEVERFEKLVRDSERVQVLKDMFNSERYVGIEDVKRVLGMNEEDK